MIIEIENAIIARVQLATTVDDQSVIRACESLPTNLTEQELTKRLRNAPAVYVSFLGGQAIRENEASIEGEFVVYFLTRNAGGEKQRRTGDATAIGAYDLMQLCIPALQGLPVPDVGSLSLKSVANLFAETLDAQGMSLYSAAFAIPMAFETPELGGNIAPFERFHADWVLAPGQHYDGDLPAPADAVAAQDDVNLPQ